MLNFKKITLEDIKELTPILRMQEYGTCDFTQLGIFMWKDCFCYEYAIEKDILFLRSNYHDKGLSEYFLPITTKDRIEEGIDLIVSNETDKEIIFQAVPESYRSYLEKYEYIESRNLREYADYIYPASALATLTGKKYNKKRNLIHQFLNQYPNYKLVPIDKDNINSIIDFHRKNRATSEETFLEKYENDLVDVVLNNYDSFSLEGEILLVNDSIAAFSIGEIIGDCLYVHIEKGDRLYKGVFQVLNWAFLNEQIKNYPNITIVNREEDMGDEGLRQAKMSYFPELINKYREIISNEKR